MKYKSIVLFLIAIGLVAGLYSIPSYKDWLEKKIFTISNFREQIAHMEIEERRESRYGYGYSIMKDMSVKLRTMEHVTILLPPDAYLVANQINYIKMVEPALFYYFTGLHSVTLTSPNVWTATWAIIAKGPGQLSLLKFGSRQQLDSQIALFRHYQP